MSAKNVPRRPRVTLSLEVGDEMGDSVEVKVKVETEGGLKAHPKNTEESLKDAESRLVCQSGQLLPLYEILPDKRKQSVA